MLGIHGIEATDSERDHALVKYIHLGGKMSIRKQRAFY